MHQYVEHIALRGDVTRVPGRITLAYVWFDAMTVLSTFVLAHRLVANPPCPTWGACAEIRSCSHSIEAGRVALRDVTAMTFVPIVAFAVFRG